VKSDLNLSSMEMWYNRPRTTGWKRAMFIMSTACAPNSACARACRARGRATCRKGVGRAHLFAGKRVHAQPADPMLLKAHPSFACKHVHAQPVGPMLLKARSSFACKHVHAQPAGPMLLKARSSFACKHIHAQPAGPIRASYLLHHRDKGAGVPVGHRACLPASLPACRWGPMHCLHDCIFVALQHCKERGRIYLCLASTRTRADTQSADACSPHPTMLQVQLKSLL